MKFSSFISFFVLLVVVPNVASAVTCGGKTCASSGSWVSVGSGIQVRSLGYCVTANSREYCAASAARCMAGYFADTRSGNICEAVTPNAGYAPRCPSSTGPLCFGLSCTKCSDYTGDSKATSVAGTAENSCGCYLAASSTLNEGTNGDFKYTSKCYYTDSTDCATTRPVSVEVTNPGQNSTCPGSAAPGGGTLS